MRTEPIVASEQTGLNRVHGWNFAENAGAAARVLLRDGSAAGDIVADIRLAAGESAGEQYPDPLELSGKLYVDVSSGAVRGAVYGG